MAFNWLSTRQSGWERNVDEPNMARRVVLGGLAILVLGVLIGVGGSALLSKDKPVVADTSVVSPNIDDLKAAPKTSDGAVQAVTSYVAGFPSLALRTSDQQSKVLNEIVAPSADSSIRSDLAKGLINSRDQLIGANSATGSLAARLVVSPASYKVDMLTPDRARVQVWVQNVLVDSSQQRASSIWVTHDVQVQWSDHWRIATLSTTNGPTPPLLATGAQPSTFSEVLNVMNGFKAYRSATAAPSGS